METTNFQMDEDSLVYHDLQESSSPRMAKSSSLQRTHGLHAFRLSDAHYDLQESTMVHSPDRLENGMSLAAPERLSTIKIHDSFIMRMPKLPKVDVHSANDQASNDSDPELPISRLLTSDAEHEHCHSQNFSRPFGHCADRSFKQREPTNAHPQQPSVWRLVKLSFPEWLYALLGGIGAAIFGSFNSLFKQSGPKNAHPQQPTVWRLVKLSFPEWLYTLLGGIGAAIFGSFNPLFAYTIAVIVASYYRISDQDIHSEVDRWCLIITCMGIITVVVNFLQHFYFGITGEKMTEQVRRMMFSENMVYWTLKGHSGNAPEGFCSP